MNCMDFTRTIRTAHELALIATGILAMSSLRCYHLGWKSTLLPTLVHGAYLYPYFNRGGEEETKEIIRQCDITLCVGNILSLIFTNSKDMSALVFSSVAYLFFQLAKNTYLADRMLWRCVTSASIFSSFPTLTL